MLYTRLVGETGMKVMKNQLNETQGFNFEQVEDNIKVWDIGGAPVLRKTWNSLYLKGIPISGLIYVVNISEELERVKESRDQFHMLLNDERMVKSEVEEGGDQKNQPLIVALVYNNKPAPPNNNQG